MSSNEYTVRIAMNEACRFYLTIICVSDKIYTIFNPFCLKCLFIKRHLRCPPVPEYPVKRLIKQIPDPITYLREIEASTEINPT